VPGWNNNGYQYLRVYGQPVAVGQLVAHTHVSPRPTGSDVHVHRRTKDAGPENAANLEWSTTPGPPATPVYAVAALGAAHFVREYESAQHAATDVGRVAETIQRAIFKGTYCCGYFWTHDMPAKGQDPARTGVPQC